MSSPKPGDRVFAVESANAKEVRLFGFGVYEGDFVPTEAESPWADEFPNPRIRLDSGEVVYGCECWWGTENDFARLHKPDGVEVVNVSITQARMDARNEAP